MEKIYITALIASTALFGLWYYTPYRLAEHYLAIAEKAINLDEKQCLEIPNLTRLCHGEKECLASLHTEYQQCTLQGKECINNNDTLHTITDLLEKHALTLDHYKKSSKEKKDWFCRYNSSLAFHGAMDDVLKFFQNLTLASLIIIPTSIDIRTDNQHVSHVTTTLSWFMYV